MLGRGRVEVVSTVDEVPDFDPPPKSTGVAVLTLRDDPMPSPRPQQRRLRVPVVRVDRGDPRAATDSRPERVKICSRYDGVPVAHSSC